MQIQQFLSAVLALHTDVDVGIARKVAARSTFAARQLLIRARYSRLRGWMAAAFEPAAAVGF
jgi:hypothetical protein